jgi:hypothetical protein
MKLDDYFKQGRARVRGQTFAIVKAKAPCLDAFAVIRDRNEITCIIDQAKMKAHRCLAIEPDFRIITFDMVLPFALIGFIAKVSRALAQDGISICALSAYSTDHILVKEKELAKAVKCLKSLGFTVEEDRAAPK